MELGDKVLRYQHESNDLGPDVIRDRLAFVVAIPSDYAVDVVIFPPGGPTAYERLYAFDPNNIYNQPGGVYWRGIEDDPPDLESYFAYFQFPEYRALVAKQSVEYDRASSQQKDAVKAGHAQQQEEERKRLDEVYKINQPEEAQPEGGADA